MSLKQNRGDSKKDSHQSQDRLAQPLSPVTYSIISLIGLIMGIGLLLLFLYKAENVTALGYGNWFFYILLVPFGLSAAAFLFGAMHSYADYKGKQIGGVIRMGGPVLAFFLVIILGFRLIPETAPFSLTVYVHGERGVQDILPANKGRVIIDLGADRVIKEIGRDGYAFFPSIPSGLRNQSVPVSVIVQGFEMAEPNRKQRLRDNALYIEMKPDKSLERVTGRVRDAEGRFIREVTIAIGGLFTTTDGNGYFSLAIPPNLQKPEHILTASKEGYNIWKASVYPQSGKAVEILLEKRQKQEGYNRL